MLQFRYKKFKPYYSVIRKDSLVSGMTVTHTVEGSFDHVWPLGYTYVKYMQCF